LEPDEENMVNSTRNRGVLWTAIALAIALTAACSSPGRRAPVTEGPAAAAAPAATASAPYPSHSPPAAPAAVKREAVNGNYIVRPGDTLRAIAAAFNVTVDDLVRWNDFDVKASLKVGQVLRLTPPAEVAVAAPITPGGGAQARPLTPGATSPPAASAPDAPPPATPAAPAPLNWGWPLPGRLLSRFGEKLDQSSPNKGIDIAATEGDPVMAAADGTVFYIGSMLPGYGNFLVLKHNDEFISVYAHNRKVLVKKDQKVKRGEAIAEAGKTSTASPRLHFEIRKDGRPVDPLPYLPKR
jgi:lipoprotein NlpD